MKKLTLATARKLIKREIGINAKLEKPTSMNGNPDYPWYQCHAGNNLFSVFTVLAVGYEPSSGTHSDRMIALRATYENSSKCITEYFYGDTLDYAGNYTAWQNRVDECQDMEIPESDAKLRRLMRAAMDDGWYHFHREEAQHDQAPIDRPAC